MEEQGIKILRTSCLWETDPMYVLEQDKFVNGVCEVSFQYPRKARDTKLFQG
jgi:7,8-dihydro-6-hydroxymethylpterin-pyrophosphokinase